MDKKTPTGIELQKARGIHNPPCKRLYSLKDAAEYLGRSVWGMRDLVWSQAIPVVMQRGSRKIFVDIVDLEDFIEKNKVLYN